MTENVGTVHTWAPLRVRVSVRVRVRVMVRVMVRVGPKPRNSNHA